MQNGNLTSCLIKNLKIAVVSDCKQCLGLGFFYEPGIHSYDKGGYIACSCISGLCGQEVCSPPYERYNPQQKAIRVCECRPVRLQLQRITALAKRSQIPEKFAGCFLDHIHLHNVSLSLALSHAEEIVSFYGRRNMKILGLYIHGGTGSGKTLLSCALLNELLRFHRASVRYAKISRDIISKLRASFNPNSDTYGEGLKIEQELSNVEVLVIDDFGMHADTPWVQSVLYDLIDARYENNLLTIVTSNEPMSAWKEIAGGRVHSRLREMCKEIAIEVQDYRVEVYGKENSY